MICAKGRSSISADYTARATEVARELFKDMNLDDNELHMCQAALVDSLKGISKIATCDGFYFFPYWFEDVRGEADIIQFTDIVWVTGLGLDDILKKHFPDMYIRDNDSKHYNNVKYWLDGFVFGMNSNGILEEICLDKDFTTNMLILASVRDNCYHFDFSRQDLPMGSTLKLIDFYKWSLDIPFIVSLLYSAVQLEGRYQSVPLS